MDRRTMLVLGAAAMPAGPSAWGRAPWADDSRSTAVKVIAIYDRPDDTEAFFRHYVAT
jgi:hypothetical protein